VADVLHPGVYIVETEDGVRPIEGVPTSTAEFAGRALVLQLQRQLSRAAPAWTDANVHDPGVTLLELCAWVLESLLHRGGAVPDRALPTLARLVAVALPRLDDRCLPADCGLRSVRAAARDGAVDAHVRRSERADESS
jgi:hypothetical protein